MRWLLPSAVDVQIFIPSPAADEWSVSGVGNVQNRDDYLRNSLPIFFVFFPPPRTISYEVASGVYDVRIYMRRSL